jgi:hypothetical protein
MGAAHAPDSVGLTQRAGGEDDRVRAGSADDDLLDAGRAGGDHAHDDGRGYGAAAAGGT